MRKRMGIGLASWLLAAAMTPASAEAGNDLAWLAGHWCMGDARDGTDELWLAANDGQLHGLSRTSRAGRIESFEFLRIQPLDGVVTYLAQPNGRLPTAFRLSASGANWVRFENPQHDFPQRIEYRRDGERLHAEIAGPGKGGKTAVIPCDMRRCAKGS